MRRTKCRLCGLQRRGFVFSHKGQTASLLSGAHGLVLIAAKLQMVEMYRRGTTAL